MNIFTKKRISSSLEDWIFYAILLETFFIALSPGMATLALVIGGVLWLVQLVVDKERRVYRHLPFDVPVAVLSCRTNGVPIRTVSSGPQVKLTVRAGLSADVGV